MTAAIILIVIGVALVVFSLVKPPAPVPPLGLIGDLNDDGVVDKADYDIMVKYLAGYSISEISPLTEAEFLRRADVNADGAVNILDLTALTGIIDEEPPPLPPIDIPAGFTISTLAFTPESTAIGYPITISIMATCISNPSGTKDFYFHINGEVLKVTTFFWKVEEPKEVSATYTPIEVRTYQVKIADLEGIFISTELPDVMLLPLPVEPLSPVSTSPGGRIKYSDWKIEPGTVPVGESVIISVIVAYRGTGGVSWGVNCALRNVAFKQKGHLSAGERILVSFQATSHVAKTFSVSINKGSRYEWFGKFTATL